MKWLIFFLFCLVQYPCLVQAGAEIADYATSEFSPARNQSFDIPFRLTSPAKVEIQIYTSDGDLVRRISSRGEIAAGKHALSWDGRDEEGTLVPNEAYVPVLVTQAGQEEEIFDPRLNSGGEVVENLSVQIAGPNEIVYQLPGPCRVLIRAGIKGGPMLRSLANWEPRSGGRNLQRWDGMDKNGLLDLRRQEELNILVTAFRLPRATILTTGNDEIDYASYRLSKGWLDRAVAPEEMRLSRNGVRISRHYYSPRNKDRDPQVGLKIVENLPLSKSGLPVVRNGQAIPVRVDIAREDLWLMNESLYEVAFFADFVFVSEEEQGYVPLTWLWEVNNLPPGEHTLTTNISGFGGKVGIASLLFEVGE